ncbi:hypothetical protein BCT75_04155 [Vibrio lentus]|uniref:hypothetical protein n=1 Tax=Vibrio lentus TaxID=136468 RepID=UPI000C85F794|nr:hypothetical protein [Vibrio lentus]PML45582.1 hypothetical protein BCT75_04155 [Vibrio lentus]
MNKLIISLAFACIPSFAFGFGGVVTDPGSYSYYATQIEQAIEQVELAEDQIKQATKTYNKVVNVDKSITGNLNRADRSLKRISDLQNVSITDVRKSMQYAKKALDEVADIPQYHTEIESEIDKTFGEENQGRGDWVNVEAEKRANKQKALKRAIIDSEVAQGKIKLQDEQLEDLALATNETNSIKDATDVTNTALLQMIEGQNEIINLLANISKNLALAEYNGDENLSTKTHIINGKDITDKSDWKTNNRNKPKSYTECNPFVSKCNRNNLIDSQWD